jgi:mannosyltransferase
MSPTAIRRTARVSVNRWSPLLLILLLAAGLRFYGLNAQSFWNDEGNTARLIERPVALILEGAAGDIHPPGYYLVLHLWWLAVGQSEVALRAYSALCGILTVAVTATASRSLGGAHRRTWLASSVAAGLVAIHPLAVYYSQEARMYAQLSLISALTLWAALALVRNGRRRPSGKASMPAILALAACIAAGLYTQYTYVLGLLGLNLAFALYSGLSRPWKGPVYVRWVAAHALGGALFLPWAPIALGAGGWRPPDLDSTRAFAEMGRALLVGVTQPRPLGPSPVLAAGLLTGAVLLVSLRAPRAGLARFGIWSALGLALAPPLLIAASGAYRPAYLKFLVPSIAPAAVALTSLLQLPAARNGSSFAALARARWLPGAGLLLITLIVPGQIVALRHLYTDPAFVRDDYRALAAAISEQGRPGDAIVLNAPNQWEVFTYYYRGPLPVYPAPYRPEREKAEGWVTDVLAKHPSGRLFALFWGDRESDPDQFIEGTLAGQAYKAGETWVTSVRLAFYGLHPHSAGRETHVDVRLGESVLLRSYALPATSWHADDVVPLALSWTTEAPLAERYKVFIHLVDDAATIVGQTDTEPHTGFRPTTTWLPGEMLVNRYGIALPPDLPPGTYTLYVGMYGFSGERLRVTGENALAGDAIRLDQITVIGPR